MKNSMSLLLWRLILLTITMIICYAAPILEEWKVPIPNCYNNEPFSSSSKTLVKLQRNFDKLLYLVDEGALVLLKSQISGSLTFTNDQEDSENRATAMNMDPNVGLTMTIVQNHLRRIHIALWYMLQVEEELFKMKPEISYNYIEMIK